MQTFICMTVRHMRSHWPHRPIRTYYSLYRHVFAYERAGQILSDKLVSQWFWMLKNYSFYGGASFSYVNMIQPNLTTGHEILKAVNDLSESWVFDLDFKGFWVKTFDLDFMSGCQVGLIHVHINKFSPRLTSSSKILQTFIFMTDRHMRTHWPHRPIRTYLSFIKGCDYHFF